MFFNELYDYDYTGELIKNNEEESGEDEEIDIKLTGEENATNKNNENITEIGQLFLYPFLFEIAIDLKNKNVFHLIDFPKFVCKK